jgi:hypothetical protein
MRCISTFPFPARLSAGCERCWHREHHDGCPQTRTRRRTAHPSPSIMSAPLTKTVCAVGGNAVSAFLSWRLSATNACDVTLVWKSGYEAVSQYGISFRYARPPTGCQLSPIRC